MTGKVLKAFFIFPKIRKRDILSYWLKNRFIWPVLLSKIKITTKKSPVKENLHIPKALFGVTLTDGLEGKKPSSS